MTEHKLSKACSRCNGNGIFGGNACPVCGCMPKYFNTQKPSTAIAPMFLAEAIISYIQSLPKYKELATARVLKKLHELEGDWVIDYSNPDAVFCHAVYRRTDKQFVVKFDWCSMQYVPTEWYSTKEAWQYVIDHMADDLKLMFGIIDSL